MEETLDVVLVTPRFAPQIGGAETYTLELARALARRGHRLRVLARGGSGLDSADIGPIRVERLPAPRIGFDLGVERAIVTAPPDVILAQYSGLPFAVRAARQVNVPVVAIVHDLYGAVESRRKYGLVRGSLRYLAIERPLAAWSPDLFLVPSRATGERVRTVLGARDVVVANPGADHVRASNGTRDPSCLLFVGRLVPSKGADALIDVVRDLRARGRDVRAEIVGTGPQERALRAQAAGLGSAVRFLGEIDNAALDAAFGRAGMLVLPSVREGWGLVLTEAAARGVPYIAYGLPAVVEQHMLVGGGVIVPPGSELLADAVASLVDSPARAAHFGAAGRRNASHLTWGATAEMVEAAVEGAVACERVA